MICSKNMYVMLIVSLCAGKLCAQSSTNALIKFQNLKERHQVDWINCKLECAEKKAQLMKQELKDWTKFINAYTQCAADGINCASKNSCAVISGKAYGDNKLHDAITLSKKHKKTWRDLVEKEYKHIQQLADKQDKELKDFEEAFDIEKPLSTITIEEQFGEY